MALDGARRIPHQLKAGDVVSVFSWRADDGATGFPADGPFFGHHVQPALQQHQGTLVTYLGDERWEVHWTSGRWRGINAVVRQEQLQWVPQQGAPLPVKDEGASPAATTHATEPRSDDFRTVEKEIFDCAQPPSSASSTPTTPPVPPAPHAPQQAACAPAPNDLPLSRQTVLSMTTLPLTVTSVRQIKRARERAEVASDRSPMALAQGRESLAARQPKRSATPTASNQPIVSIGNAPSGAPAAAAVGTASAARSMPPFAALSTATACRPGAASEDNAPSVPDRSSAFADALCSVWRAPAWTLPLYTLSELPRPPPPRRYTTRRPRPPVPRVTDHGAVDAPAPAGVSSSPRADVSAIDNPSEANPLRELSGPPTAAEHAEQQEANGRLSMADGQQGGQRERPGGHDDTRHEQVGDLLRRASAEASHRSIRCARWVVLCAS